MTMDRPLRLVTANPLPSSFPVARFAGVIELICAHDHHELLSLLRDAHVLYSWKVPESVPSETPHLRWVQVPSAGADHLRGLPIWRSNIVLSSSKGIHTVPMSEHLFAMLLSLVRRIPSIVRAQDRRAWLHHDVGPMQELRGRTMGILGWGKIGGGIAHLARSFGMRVIGLRRSVTVSETLSIPRTAPYADPPWLEPVDLEPDILYPPSQLHDVLARSDVVVLILPHTQESHGMIGESEFHAMKDGAIFLNIGRGPVVDEGALIHALQSGKLSAAGLDVFVEEPLPASSPLWSMPNVIVSPHVGGNSEQTDERGAHLLAENLDRYLQGRPLLNLVERNREY